MEDKSAADVMDGRLIRIKGEDLREILEENERLKKQVTLLQEMNNIQVFAKRPGQHVLVLTGSGDHWEVLTGQEGVQVLVVNDAGLRFLEDGHVPQELNSKEHDLRAWNLTYLLGMTGENK